MLLGALALFAVLIDSPMSDAADSRRIFVEFREPSEKEYARIHGAVTEDPRFQNVADAVDEVVALPSRITLRFEECGNARPVYNPQTGKVSICYEDIDADMTRDLGMTDEEERQYILSAATFHFLHGIGHALITELKIPVTGSPVEAADEFSTMITLLAGDALDTASMEGIASFALDAAAAQSRRKHLVNLPALDEGRAQRIACLIYGSDPAALSSLTAPGALPQDRAHGCEAEFNERLLAWSNLLDSHLRK